MKLRSGNIYPCPLNEYYFCDGCHERKYVHTMLPYEQKMYCQSCSTSIYRAMLGFYNRPFRCRDTMFMLDYEKYQLEN